MVRRANWPRLVMVSLTVTALTALAALPLARIYRGDLLILLLLGAAAAPALIPRAVRRLRATPAAPISVLALGGYSLLAVRLAATGGEVTGPLPNLWADAARNGIPRLLTALIPVEPRPDTVLVPVVATWLAGMAAAELAVRHRRVLLGYAPPTALYAGALVVVGPNARPQVWQALAYTAVAALGLAATGRRGASAPTGLPPRARLSLRLRLTSGAAGAAAVVVALALAVGPALAPQINAPTDLRRYVPPPQLDARDTNPLIRLSGWAINRDQPLFDADIGGAGATGRVRVRLAVLSDYDGVNWRVAGAYREAGRALPPVTGPGAVTGEGASEGNGGQVHERIRIDELDGRLLPAVPAAREVDGVRVAYDQTTGTLLKPDGLTSGLTYTVYSQQSILDVNELPGTDVPSGPAVARYLELGATPPQQMRRLADQLGGQVADPYQKAQAIADFLGEHYQLAGDAPTGHAYPNLNFFLFAARSAGGQRGGTEQFAAAFAVLARMLGLPSRVVVGFQAAPGHTTVRGKDALAWPEVLFTGLGWVAFDPLPQPDTQQRPMESDFQPKSDPSTPPPSNAPTISVSGPTPAASRTPQAIAEPPADLPVGPFGAGTGLVAALLGAAVAIVALRRAQRARRLEQGSPAQRVVGAWREVLDGLRLAGRPAGAHLAATEVAEYAALAAGSRGHAHRRGRLRLPPPPLTDLARLVNSAAFAQQATTEEQARLARAQAVAYVGELRARRRWWRRLLWSIDPRPLHWGRRLR